MQQQKRAPNSDADQSAALSPESAPAVGMGNAAMSDLIGQLQESEVALEGKAKHTHKGVVGEPSAMLVGHMMPRLHQAHHVHMLENGDCAINLSRADLTTEIRIWPRESGPYYSPLLEFASYYGSGYDPKFNVYEGVMKHEEQHVQEALASYEALIGTFRGEVAAIANPSAVAAEQLYQEAWKRFQDAFRKDFMASGEDPARKAEWRHYHQCFEQCLCNPLQYDFLDWMVSAEEAGKVLDILEKVTKGARLQAVEAMGNQGLLDTFQRELSGNDLARWHEIVRALNG